jgi:hypothetical protein
LKYGLDIFSPFSALAESKVHRIFKLTVQDLGFSLIQYSQGTDMDVDRPF